MTRDAAVKHAKELARANNRQHGTSLSAVPLPPLANWKGPISKLCLDDSMKKVHDDLKKYESLARRLRSKLPPSDLYDDARSVLYQTIACLDAGLEYQDADGADQNPPPNGLSFDERFNLRRKQVEWLEYLCKTVPNIPTEQIELDAAGKVFLQRVLKMGENVKPDAPLKTVAMTRAELRDRINKVCGAAGREKTMSIQKHRFTQQETERYCTQLEALGILT